MADQEKGNLRLEERTTNFPRLLQELDGGVIANVLGLAASNVARAVSYANKKGEINIKLIMKPMGTNNEMVEITSNMNFTEPKSGFGCKKEDFQYASIAYVGPGGKLTYDKPKEDVNSQLQLAINKQA